MLGRDIPVIMPFTVDNCFYVYDTYKNQIIELPVSLIPEVKSILKLGRTEYLEKMNSNNEHKCIVHLIDKGYFQSSHIESMEFPYIDKATTIAGRCLRHMVLQVTKRCNFKCRYCAYAVSDFSRDHENVDMEWECAKKAIDFLFSHSKDAKLVMLSFYGGEPMLNFDLIKKSIEYADNIFTSKPILYSMTCNGSVLSDEYVSFFERHNVRILISLDGPEFIQNRNRKFCASGVGSFEIVYKNVVNIIEKHNAYFLKNIAFNPVLINDNDRMKVEEFFINHLKVPKEKVSPKYANLSGMDYIHPVYYKPHLDVMEYSDAFEKTKNKISECEVISSTYCHGGPCIPGLTKLFVNTQGKFYLCEKVNELNKIYELGDVYNGYNSQSIKNLYNVVKLTEEKCKSCWQIRLCDICAMDCGADSSCGFSDTQKLMKCNSQGKMLLGHLKKIVKNEV